MVVFLKVIVGGSVFGIIVGLLISNLSLNFGFKYLLTTILAFFTAWYLANYTVKSWKYESYGVGMRVAKILDCIGIFTYIIFPLIFFHAPVVMLSGNIIFYDNILTSLFLSLGFPFIEGVIISYFSVRKVKSRF